MRRALSHAFAPPAAVVPITVRFPDDAEERTLEGKIDTGADLCAVPESVITDLELPPERIVRVTTAFRPPGEEIVYRMDCTVAGERFRYVETLATARPYCIIGRNVLRELVLRMDGPREIVELRRPRKRKVRRI